MSAREMDKSVKKFNFERKLEQENEKYNMIQYESRTSDLWTCVPWSL